MFELIPWRERRLMRLFEPTIGNIIDRFFEGWPFSSERRSDTWLPEVDVAETSKEVVVSAELPGMNPENIEVSLRGNSLCISGERKHEEEEKNEVMHRIERSYGSFCRVIDLPSKVKADGVEATYKNGVLKIRLPKAEEENVIKIELKEAA
jgi:HSP20 family protein